MIIRKSASELELMRRAGAVVAETITRVVEAVAPGVTTLELDRIAARVIADAGAEPSFLGYGGGGGRIPFPATICASINDEIVHGIPSADRVLRDGDLVSLDFGAIWEGFHSDSAVTVFVGRAARATTRSACPRRPRPRSTRRSRSCARRPAVRHRPRDRAGRDRARVGDRARVRRPRDRPGDARGPLHPELGPRRPRPRAEARARDRDRADAQPRRRCDPGARPTVDGRAPPTVPSQRTSSTPWP